MSLDLSNRAVNPVVATILMVAIVVILSASVGAFVLQLGTDLNDGQRGAAEIVKTSIDGKDGFVKVSVLSLNNAEHLKIAAIADNGNQIRAADGSNTIERAWTRSSSGDLVTIKEGDASGGSSETTIRIVVTAHDSGGASLVLEKEVTI